MILAAWKKAKQSVPGLRLRILTSEETIDSIEQILDMLPEGVTLWYYHSLTTYCNSETEIIPDYLVQAIKKGKRIGVVPDIGVSSSYANPFSSAQFIRYRMNEFVDKGIAALMGYPRPSIVLCEFNVEAAGEWSWNAKGRSTREFALSWAVRHGLPDPEKFADWSETLGPVSWDVYGSEWPNGEGRKSLERVATQLEKGTLPELGAVLWDVYPKPWGDIKSDRQLDEDVARAARAVQMAKDMSNPSRLQESLVIQGYIGSLKALYELKKIVKPDGIPEAQREIACRYFQAYVDSLRQVQVGVVEWEKSIRQQSPRPGAARKTVEFLDTFIEDMSKTATKLGCTVK